MCVCVCVCVSVYVCVCLQLLSKMHILKGYRCVNCT